MQQRSRPPVPPLASGHLTGKYLRGTIPAGLRLDLASQFTRYNGPQQPDATARYLGVARASGIDPVGWRWVSSTRRHSSPA